jgi:hypothetical protein
MAMTAGSSWRNAWASRKALFGPSVIFLDAQARRKAASESGRRAMKGHREGFDARADSVRARRWQLALAESGFPALVEIPP